MKALKSQLAKDVLADPGGRAALREYLTSPAAAGGATNPPKIAITSKGRTVRVYPSVVPKAD
jgi:hypothetical protein